MVLEALRLRCLKRRPGAQDKLDRAHRNRRPTAGSVTSAPPGIYSP